MSPWWEAPGPRRIGFVSQERLDRPLLAGSAPCGAVAGLSGPRRIGFVSQKRLHPLVPVPVRSVPPRVPHGRGGATAATPGGLGAARMARRRGAYPAPRRGQNQLVKERVRVPFGMVGRSRRAGTTGTLGTAVPTRGRVPKCRRRDSSPPPYDATRDRNARARRPPEHDLRRKRRADSGLRSSATPADFLSRNARRTLCGRSSGACRTEAGVPAARLGPRRDAPLRGCEPRRLGSQPSCSQGVTPLARREVAS